MRFEGRDQHAEAELAALEANMNLLGLVLESPKAFAQREARMAYVRAVGRYIDAEMALKHPRSLA